MAVAPTLVIQCIRFFANDRCKADPSSFQALRDMVQRGWQEKGLKAQYWGPSVAKATELYWLLLWESYEHALACKADPSYPTVLQERDALVNTDRPICDVHIPFSGNPMRAIQSPVTEIDFYKTLDDKVDPRARPVAETQEMVRQLENLADSLQSPGYIGISAGVALEDETRGVTIVGWRSIEEHMLLGTLDGHKGFVDDCEVVFKHLSELSIEHVYFKLHDAVSSA